MKSCSIQVSSPHLHHLLIFASAYHSSRLEFSCGLVLQDLGPQVPRTVIRRSQSLWPRGKRHSGATRAGKIPPGRQLHVLLRLGHDFPFLHSSLLLRGGRPLVPHPLVLHRSRCRKLTIPLTIGTPSSSTNQQESGGLGLQIPKETPLEHGALLQLLYSRHSCQLCDYSNNGTFTLCSTAGASATFTFTGTSVWIFGAKRDNHGPYTINLDGAVTTDSGFANSPGLFQTPLFSAKGLQHRSHTLTITNSLNNDTRPYLDIDFITWTSEAKDDQSTFLPNTDSHFSYDPPTSWSSASQEGFNSSAARSTLESGASMFLKFSGESVTVFGAIGPTSAPYTVELDGEAPSSYNATKDLYTPQVMLYHTDNLSSGDHTLKLTSAPANSGQALSIDYALVRGLINSDE
ncbi:hypothetical protein HGRIS_006993 [Hohenbuehelia grisea]|uniref:Uncharacterized protein n=1 Tax=Hohenbuehelia grisea TaxID=104357 RepID=A0ABR3JCB7_9AGAR